MRIFRWSRGDQQPRNGAEGARGRRRPPGPRHDDRRPHRRPRRGLAEALDRAAAYAQAGADLLFVEGLPEEDELRAEGAAVQGKPKPASIVEGGRTPLVPRARLREHGTLEPVLDRLTPWTRRQQLVRRDHHQEPEQRYRAE